MQISWNPFGCCAEKPSQGATVDTGRCAGIQAKVDGALDQGGGRGCGEKLDSGYIFAFVFFGLFSILVLSIYLFSVPQLNGGAEDL